MRCLYPVPTSDWIELRSSGAATLTRISVLDALGRVVFQQNMVNSPQRIDVSGLATGRYVLRVEHADPAVPGTSSVLDHVFLVVKDRQAKLQVPRMNTSAALVRSRSELKKVGGLYCSC